MTRQRPIRVLAIALSGVGLALPATSAYASPPPPPVLTTVGDGADSFDSTPTIVCSGASPLALITVYVDGGADGTGGANAGGHCSFPAQAMTDGAHAITITQTVLGEESAPSNAIGFDLRTVAPTIAYPGDTLAIDPASMSIHGYNAFDNGGVVAVIDGTEQSGTADADGLFVIALPTPVAAGVHTVSVYNVDSHSVHGPSSATQHFYYVPAPTLTSPNDQWFNPHGAAVDLPFSGAEPGAKIRLYANGGGPVLSTAIADPSGNGTISTPGAPSDGIHDYSITQDDHLGHVSAQSQLARIYTDSTPPATPGLLSPDVGQPVTNPSQMFVYSAESMVVVHYEIDGVDQPPLGSIGDGTVDLFPPAALSEGAHTIRAKAVDFAGNESAWSPTAAFTIDSLPPSQLELVEPTQDSSDSSGHLHLQTEAYAAVTVSLDAGPVLHDTADDLGQVFFDVGALADGDHALATTATDAAGNASSLTLHFTTDTTAPTAPAISSPVAGDVVTVRRPQIVFMADPDTVVAISIDGQSRGPSTTDANGAGTFATALDDGQHTVTITATDEAGNSAQSTPVTFTVAVPGPPSDPPTQTPPDTTSHTPLTPALTLSGVSLRGSVLATCTRRQRHCTEKTAKLSLRVSAAATIKLALTRKVHGHAQTAATVSLKASKAGPVTYVLHRKAGGHTLAAGSYKLVVQATAKSGGATSATVTKSISVR